MCTAVTVLRKEESPDGGAILQLGRDHALAGFRLEPHWLGAGAAPRCGTVMGSWTFPGYFAALNQALVAPASSFRHATFGVIPGWLPCLSCTLLPFSPVPGAFVVGWYRGVSVSVCVLCVPPEGGPDSIRDTSSEIPPLNPSLFPSHPRDARSIRTEYVHTIACHIRLLHHLAPPSTTQDRGVEDSRCSQCGGRLMSRKMTTAE